MRPFLFRAWDIRNNCWLSGPFSLTGEFMILQGLPLLRLNDLKIDQFTGLYDKNKVKIFENDIVKFSEYYSGDYHNKESIELIEWDINSFNDKLLVGYADYPSWCEVIGNKYENPELL